MTFRRCCIAFKCVFCFKNAFLFQDSDGEKSDDLVVDVSNEVGNRRNGTAVVVALKKTR